MQYTKYETKTPMDTLHHTNGVYITKEITLKHTFDLYKVNNRNENS